MVNVGDSTCAQGCGSGAWWGRDRFAKARGDEGCVIVDEKGCGVSCVIHIHSW